MRKVLIALVILAVGLSGLLIWHCSGIEMESNQVRIGVTVYQMEDPFIAQIPQYIEKIAKEYEEEHGVRVFVDVVDAMGNQNLQNDQVSQFLDRDFDVLCVNMVDRTAAGSIVDKAMQADVPVVFFNREPVEEDMRRWDKLYYVCSKADESGVLEGGIVVDAYQAQPERWDKNGDGKLQYVLLEGEQGHQDSLIRTEVTIKTITDAGQAGGRDRRLAAGPGEGAHGAVGPGVWGPDRAGHQQQRQYGSGGSGYLRRPGH